MSVNHVLHVRPACTSTLSVAGVSSVLVVITLMGGTLAVRRVLGHQNQWPVWSTGTGITYRPAPTSPASVYISVVSTSCSSCRGILIWHDWNRTSLCAQFVQAAHCSPPTIFFLKIPTFWCSTFKFRIFTEQNWGSPPTHSRENSPLGQFCDGWSQTCLLLSPWSSLSYSRVQKIWGVGQIFSQFFLTIPTFSCMLKYGSLTGKTLEVDTHTSGKYPLNFLSQIWCLLLSWGVYLRATKTGNVWWLITNNHKNQLAMPSTFWHQLWLVAKSTHFTGN